jgi:hypothetical protein
MCNLHNNKEMKRLNCGLEDLEKNMEYIRPSKYNKYRIWIKNYLNKAQIKANLIATEAKIFKLEESLGDNFLGVAIVVVET